RCGRVARKGCYASCRRWKRASCIQAAGTSAAMATARSAGMTCRRPRPITWRPAWKACGSWAEAFATRPLNSPLGRPIDRKPRPSLAHRHQLEAVDVEMRRLVEDPEDGLGDILRLDRLDTGIGRVVARLVAAEAHQGELALAHPRLDIADPYARAAQVATQAQGELTDEGLGAAVHMAARIGVDARHRTDIEDGRATAMGDQPWQQQAGGVHQAL